MISNVHLFVFALVNEVLHVLSLKGFTQLDKYFFRDD